MEINKEIVKNIIYDTYNAFAKTDNIRQTLLSAFPYPEDCTETILDDFVDIMFKTFPQSLEQLSLFVKK